MLIAAAACALLTSAEIQRVQGEPVQGTKSSEGGVPGLVSERCFFTLPTFTKSISLEVTRGEGVPALWRKGFHERESAEKEKEDAPPPERVRGIGDEAFWTGDQRLGALYVLRRHAMLRLSVGGPQAKAVKLGKLKTLARAALKRL